MPGTLTIPLVTLAPGSHDYGPVNLPDADTSVELAIDRTVANGFNSQPATTRAAISVYQSDDGGATWYLLASATFEGGTYFYKGQPAGTSAVGIRLAPGTGRRGKANVTVTGGSVAVQGTLTTR